MMCMFCGNRKKCWNDMNDEALSMEWVKCDYEDYILDDEIDIEDLIEESNRRQKELINVELNENIG